MLAKLTDKVSSKTYMAEIFNIEASPTDPQKTLLVAGYPAASVEIAAPFSEVEQIIREAVLRAQLPDLTVYAVANRLTPEKLAKHWRSQGL